MFLLVLMIFPSTVAAQLTVGGWFFPVSVPPPNPNENTVYDEDVALPEAEPVNVTHQEIKNDMDHTSTTTQDPLEISKSKRFLPGIQQFVPASINPGSLPLNEEPVITMSMTPIKSLRQPEEISAEITRNLKAEQAMLEISSTTEQVKTTKLPFIYGIPKTKSFDDPLSAVEKEREMMKLKRDVFRLRNEMNLVKALLNKMYKRMYRKQKDFLMKKTTNDSTRLSAVQTEANNHDWTVIRAQHRSQVNA
ncbi:Protein CBG22804 [Caenorhabditis briggsae]|uniref:Protein CBG22804 n=1 Tax=Caenorhabditis briggsae TaxID=6238 RepID=A8Y2X3_CAEBR|nr:Protein CBG22804 [Caenorhabditis briggsae]CAP39307.2 Protein CBG22804 [Caenorhabditis briggsae]